MAETTISVVPVQGGWAVQCPEREASMFLSGGRAETHARKLGEAIGSSGASAQVLIHNRDGAFIGAWRFGAAG